MSDSIDQSLTLPYVPDSRLCYASVSAVGEELRQVAVGLFFQVLAKEAVRPTIPGISRMEVIQARGSDLYLRLHWPTLASNMWKGAHHTSAEAGNCLPLMAFLTLPLKALHLSVMFLEAWQFSGYLFEDQLTANQQVKIPLPYLWETRYRALRRRLQLWLRGGKEGSFGRFDLFSEKLTKVLAPISVKPSSKKQYSAPVTERDTLIHVDTLMRFVNKTYDYRMPANAAVDLTFSGADEVAALLHDQRVGVINHDRHLAIYMPSYLQHLFDLNHSTPWFDFQKVQKEYDAPYGQPLPLTASVDLQRKLRVFLGKRVPFDSVAYTEAIWKTLTNAPPFEEESTFSISIKSARMLAGVPIRQKKEPAFQNPDAPQSMKRIDRYAKVYRYKLPDEFRQYFKDGIVNYIWTPKNGAYIEVGDRIPPLIEAHVMNNLRPYSLTGYKEALSQVRWHVKTPGLDAWTPVIRYFYTIGIVTAVMAEWPHLLQDELFRVFSGARPKNYTDLQDTGVPVKPVYRERLPYILKEDLTIISYLRGRKRLRGFQCSHLSIDELPRHTARGIGNRARYLAFMHAKGHTLWEARDAKIAAKYASLPSGPKSVIHSDCTRDLETLKSLPEDHKWALAFFRASLENYPRADVVQADSVGQLDAG